MSRALGYYPWVGTVLHRVILSVQLFELTIILNSVSEVD